MTDYEAVDNAMTMLDTAEVVNKFTETVWLCVDRHAWDEYVRSKEMENEVA